MFEESLFGKSLKMYIDDLEQKNWSDLTKEQIYTIRDDLKRKEYLKKYHECMKIVILPLLYNIGNSNKFHFTNPDNLLTSNNMMKDIYNYYKKRGFNKEDLITIASEKKVGKGY